MQFFVEKDKNIRLANTEFMKKIFYTLLPFIFFACPLFSCQSKTPSPQSSIIKIPNTPPDRLMEQPPSTIQTPNEQTPAPTNIWNVDDVDISYVSRERKLISFTFDDSPSTHLENLLSVFADFNEKNPDCKATATVFCNGYLFDNANAHTLHNACAMGWELGNHSYSHPDMAKLSKEDALTEIEKTDKALQAIDGKSTHLFRPPFGSISEIVKEVCPTPIINWTIDTLDWSGTSVEDIQTQVLTQKYPGAIVLMHDHCPNTVDALKTLLPNLKEEGYQVVSVSALAKMHNCTLKRGSVYIRARKNGNG